MPNVEDRPVPRFSPTPLPERCAALHETTERHDRELWQLFQRIPEDLREILHDLGGKVDRLMEEGLYVKKADFDLLRLEHDQMKRLVYGALGIILTAFTVALVALVWRQ